MAGCWIFIIWSTWKPNIKFIMLEVINKKKVFTYAIVDAIVLGIVGFIPALSHATGLPIYLAEPMRICLFIGFLIAKDRYNLLLLALLIPQISTMFSGHPPFIKSVIISMELFFNALLFLYFVNFQKWNLFLVFGASIILSKIIYYTIKYLFISFSMLKGELLSTPLLPQLISGLVFSVVFGLIYKKYYQE